jgi:hypothetical protein
MNKMKQTLLTGEYGWVTSSRFSEPVQDVLVAAASAIQNWLQRSPTPIILPNDFLYRKSGKVYWEPANLIWRLAGFHHVELHTVFIYPERITVETAVHEIAHVLDNTFGPHGISAILGGGPSDAMFRYIGGEPDLFFPRFLGFRYESYLRENQLELNATVYGKSRGPAEDFAEAFQLAVLNPELLKTKAPKRFEWFSNWRNQIIR